ncbi:hypothetical protein BG011_004021 [Mortierella polycephala]|uniref:separase n=1 Tax=Mortierella polycephala TaxID=41804 RepID=A0A9P6Q0X6_9FUNG|nr:hypothetical protein BG011_004021 [Mortierella polycephala]
MTKPLNSKLHWAMILIEASLARSQLLFNEGNLTEAISDAMRAYRQLCRIVGSLSVALEAAKRERMEAAVRQQPMENPFLVQKEDQATTNGQRRERSSAETQQLRQGLELLATQRYQWSIFRLIIETFHHLAKLYLIQGSAREAEYFVMEGKHMALVSKAGKSMDQFLFDQAQLGLRKHQWKESKEILEELAMQEDESGSGAFTWEIQDARIQLLYGDYYFALERLDHSLDAYFRTDQVLSHLMDKSVISGLEQLVIREPQTPREKELATLYYHQKSHGQQKLMRRLQFGSHSSVELHGQEPMRTSTSDLAQFECATLNEIKVAMGYRASLVYFLKGHKTQALDLIEKSKAEDPMVFAISEYHLAKAKMLMLELEDTMAKHLMYAMIPDSALSVGLFKKTRTLQLDPPPVLYTRQSANPNGDDDNLMDDVYALSSLIMNPPIGVGSAISSSPSVRVKKMTRRRRSQLAYEEALSNVAPQPTSPKKSSLTRYVEILMDARKHLSEAYRYSIPACPPHIVSDICGRQAYLAVLESCFHQETEALISEDGSGCSSQWTMACRAACYLEKAKAVSQWREMQGLIKQKLNPILPQEDQAWPREIQLKNSTGLNQGSTWSILPGQGKIPPQTQRTGRKTISYIGLEKPQRLQFNTSIDDRLNTDHPEPIDIVDSVADDDEGAEDIDLAEVGMKPEDLRTRQGKREYLNRRLLVHPSSSMGNERSFLEILGKAYEQDAQIMDGGIDDDLGQNFQRDFIDIIPEKWVVVSLSMDVEHEVMYVNRLRAKAMPIVVRLPLNRDQLREGDDQELGLRLGLGLRGMSEFDDEEQNTRGDPLSYKDAAEELQGILKGSQETLNVASTGATLSSSTEFGRPQPVELTREVKAEWWSQRQRLDDRLCALLGTMEDQWLCGLKGLIQSHNTPADMDNLLRFKKALEWIMSQAANSMPSSASASGAHAGKSSRQGSLTQLEISVELCRAILNLGDQPTFVELKDLIYFLLDAYLYKSVSVSSPSSIGVSVAESPFQPPSHSTSFTSPFIDYSEVQFGRIAMQIKEALRCYWLAETQAKNNGYDDGAHVILILDKHLQSFPWESCPVLRGEAVSRVPSMWFLRDRILQQRYRVAQGQGQAQTQAQAQTQTQDEPQIWRDLEVDPQRTYYILNPAGDLKNTETEFREYVEAQEGWDGVLGRAPMPLEVMNGLSQNELYVYFGHSGGEQYIKSSQIRQLGNCAVSLLLGCSSGSLKGAGEFDPTGNAVNYLLAGCPTLVANLWDVTDRDLDRFSKAMFSLWGLDQNCRGAGMRQHQEQQMMEAAEDMEDVQQQGPAAEDDYDEEEAEKEEVRRGEQGLRLSIVEAVKEARDECRLKYLVGAASVVYGIPCYVKA